MISAGMRTWQREPCDSRVEGCKIVVAITVESGSANSREDEESEWPLPQMGDHWRICKEEKGKNERKRKVKVRGTKTKQREE